VDRCGSCGAGLSVATTWCPQCFAPAGRAATAIALAPDRPEPAVFGAVGRPPPPAPVTVPTRWRKTPTTFGPVGRSLATVALVVPLALMAVGGIVDPLVWGGLFVWVGVVMPLALRDIWKVGRIPVR
jgi:hypothetical protein